jgi:TRAP-type C4-dicarboxylate transport system permease small subunit
MMHQSETTTSTGAAAPRPTLLRRTLDALYLGGGILSGLFLVAILLLMMALSLGRPLGINIPSGDDFAAWSLVGMSFMGLAHTFKRGEMIRVGLLLERLKGGRKRAAELFSLTVGTLFIGYFFAQALRFASDSWRFSDASTGVIVVPLWIPQSAMVLGLGLLLLAFLDELWTVINGGKPTYEKEPPATPEELLDRVASGGGV